MIVVPDAGPLIYLAGAEQLDLLRHLYRRVVVPRAVFAEVTVSGAGMLGAAVVASATWIEVAEVEPEPTLLEVLDRGESSAIPLAERLGALLLVDDGTARLVAKRRGLKVIGTVGVLIAAKRRQLLPRVGPVLDRMIESGMFVSAALRERVLIAVDETE